MSTDLDLCMNDLKCEGRYIGEPLFTLDSNLFVDREIVAPVDAFVDRNLAF